ncbi:MAG: O-antigen ligase family protein [Acidothermaceae bacterium]
MTDILTRPRSEARVDVRSHEESPGVDPTPRRSWTPDAAAMLSLLCGLLFLLPARLVVPGLGAAGRPANILGVALFALWCLGRLVPGLTSRRPQPLHWILGAFVGFMMLSWWLAYARGVQPAEGRSAGRYVIELVSLVGMALTAADGLFTRRRLDTVLVRLCYWAGVMAAFGTFEFFTRINAAAYIKIPGLQLNHDLTGVAHRGGGGYNGNLFARVAGTALHYIEFGAVLSMCLPIALHYAIYAKPGRQRKFRWVLFGLLFMNLPFAMSRSAVVGLAVVAITMLTVWARPMLMRVGIGFVLALGAFKVAVPGLIGTIRALFTNLSTDPSIQGRTSDYAAITPLIHARPWFGRGGGTYIPDLYRVLDNQYLLTLLEWGLIGLMIMIIVFLSPVFMGRAVRRQAPDDEARHLGQSLMAAALVGVVLSGTFDSLSFPTFASTFFIIIGVTAALWRLTVVERQPRYATHTPSFAVMRQPFDVGRLLPETARKYPSRRVPAAPVEPHRPRGELNRPDE